MLTIESQDARFRVTVAEVEAGVEVRLYRHAGAVNQGAIRWRQMERCVIDQPFHRVVDAAYDRVGCLVDERPRTMGSRR